MVENNVVENTETSKEPESVVAENETTPQVPTPKEVAKSVEKAPKDLEKSVETEVKSESENFAKLREQLKVQSEIVKSLQEKNLATERQLFAEKNGVPEALLKGKTNEEWTEVATIYLESVEKAKAEAIGQSYSPTGKSETSTTAEGFASIIKNNWSK